MSIRSSTERKESSLFIVRGKHELVIPRSPGVMHNAPIPPAKLFGVLAEHQTIHTVGTDAAVFIPPQFACYIR